MATTWIKPLHIRKDRTILQSIAERTDYAGNLEKTEQGNLVKGYACDPRSVDEEFMLSKKEYEYLTGRDNGKKNVIAYHIRQAFKPGEISPEEALEVGYELAARFTKNKHAYIVAVHNDKHHVHCHIVFNSTRLDCKGKFNNFLGSSFAVRRLSDIICAEHGLSVIENPKPSKGKNYAEWLGGKEPSWQDKLRRKIDEVLPACGTFADFLTAMRAAGYKVNDKRKHITFLAPGQTKPTRLDTLRGDYTEAVIRERLAEGRTAADSNQAMEQTTTAPLTASGGSFIQKPDAVRVNLLIDIQAKIREGKGAGYENWARIFNLKEAARTLVFLKENGIDSYDDLKEKASTALSGFSALSEKIKAADKRLAAISELQKYIGSYGKTRDVYAGYVKAGRSEKYYEEHRADITLHMAAKKYFDGQGYGKNKKLPTIAALKQEYAALLTEKKKLYTSYHAVKAGMQELLIAKGNADKILGIKESTGQERREVKAQALD
jgi:hypothetical protein